MVLIIPVLINMHSAMQLLTASTLTTATTWLAHLSHFRRRVDCIQ